MEGHVVAKPADLLKEPLVLEFLGVDEKASYSESDLESALITHLERFLLELGKGFLFEAQQKRFTFDGSVVELETQLAKPYPQADSLAAALRVIDADANGCFFG